MELADIFGFHHRGASNVSGMVMAWNSAQSVNTSFQTWLEVVFAMCFV